MRVLGTPRTVKRVAFPAFAYAEQRGGFTKFIFRRRAFYACGRDGKGFAKHLIYGEMRKTLDKGRKKLYTKRIMKDFLTENGRYYIYAYTYYCRDTII